MGDAQASCVVCPQKAAPDNAEPMNEALLSDMTAVLDALRPHEAVPNNAILTDAQPQHSSCSVLFQGAAEPMNEALLSDMTAVLDALRPHEALQSMPEPVCDEGHILQNCCPQSSGFCCEECGEDLAEGHLAFRCEACGGITFCNACATSSLEKQVP